MSASMNVLLMVDILKDFCAGGSLAVQRADEVVPVANSLMRSGLFDLKIAIQEIHPPDHSSFEIWPPHCVAGTAGAEFHDDLDQTQFTHIVHKGGDRAVDSYSAFFDNEGGNETPLQQIILTEAAALGITDKRNIHLFVIGIATDYCVRGTGLDGSQLGFLTAVIQDGCRAVDSSPAAEMRVYREFVAHGIAVVDSSVILQPPMRLVANNPRREINPSV